MGDCLITDEKIGSWVINCQGEKMTVIDKHKKEGIPDWLITVKFEYTNTIRENVYWNNFKHGGVVDSFLPSICGLGYVGNTTTKINLKHKRSYVTWRAMINRCYNELDKSYRWYGKIGVTIDEEWLCYANFEKWYDENIWEYNNETMNLDKDILNKGNKTYSKTTCILVPQSINKLFLTTKKNRGKYLIGVFKNNKNKYRIFSAQMCYGDGISKSLGSYKTETEAFYSYKKAKENYIKEIADKNKDKMPKVLYDAMYLYKIEKED